MSGGQHSANHMQSIVQQQIQEAQVIREKVYQLEQAHMSIKQK